MRVAIIGAGSAGMAAARYLAKQNVETVLIDVEERLGGILNQCIHPGFGLHLFGEELTGPEFAQKLEDSIVNLPIDIRTETFVKAIELTNDKKIIVFRSPDKGEYDETFDKVIIATGARERTPAGVLTPGDRVAGIYTAGLAQTMINIKGWMPGYRVLIVGSGDVGLIMARTLYLEGAEVVGVIEINQYPGGLPRNIKSCLEDFNIPLFLSHRVVHIEGKNGRVHKVYVAEVDNNFNVISKDYKVFEVDTVLFSVGLIPNTGLLKHYINIKPGGIIDFDQNFQTDISGIHVIGNSAMIFDLADHAALSGEIAAKAILADVMPERKISIIYDGLRGYPSYITYPPIEDCVKLFIRVPRPIDESVLIINSNQGTMKLNVRDVVPAQMLEVCVPKEFISHIDDIHVSLEGH